MKTDLWRTLCPQSVPQPNEADQFKTEVWCSNTFSVHVFPASLLQGCTICLSFYLRLVKKGWMIQCSVSPIWNSSSWPSTSFQEPRLTCSANCNHIVSVWNCTEHSLWQQHVWLLSHKSNSSELCTLPFSVILCVHRQVSHRIKTRKVKESNSAACIVHMPEL